MHGNVWELCEDIFFEYPLMDIVPTGPFSSCGHYGNVIRGGSWHSNAEECRSACRGSSNPDYDSETKGFRLALDPV